MQYVIDWTLSILCTWFYKIVMIGKSLFYCFSGQICLPDSRTTWIYMLKVFFFFGGGQVIEAFQLKISEDQLMSRCTKCNGRFIQKPLSTEEAVEAAKGFQRIPDCLFDKNLQFWQCMDCNQLYWEVMSVIYLFFWLLILFILVMMIIVVANIKPK